MAELVLPFEVWKGYFRKDCEDHQKSREFDGLGEFVLRLLWEQGLEPSVQGIVAGGENIDNRS